MRDTFAYATVAVYESNPRNLDKAFALGYFHGAEGVTLPAELGITPRFGEHGLPGAYKYGAWYNTQRADDVNRTAAPPGATALRHDGRYGFFLQLQQQLTGEAESGPEGPRTKQGLVAFVNLTQTDKRTERTDNQVAGGVFYTGPSEGRPNDDIGVAVARTHVQTPHEGAEYATEIFYGVHAFPWLVLRPNVQMIIQPGGYANQDVVVIVGLKAAVTL